MPTPRKKPASGPSTEAKKRPSRKAKTAGSASGGLTSPGSPSTGVEPAASRQKRGGDGAPPPAGRGGFDLVVVESPTKAKTINKYLGPNYRVLASYGHVRDLATRKLKGEEEAGIQIANGWKLRYVVDDGSDDDGPKTRRRSAKDILGEIRQAANGANRILLASDPDREGEAIAWHIADELKLDDARTFRVRFNEITPSAIKQALAAADHIDMDRVAAQEARRAMDRIVGFPLSKLLGRKVGGGLSAGRVQSVAVKLVVDREREIEAFKTEEYWKLTALLAKQGDAVAWAADPKKSKIFAKKKPGDEANPDRKGGGGTATAEAEEPVEDTEAPEGEPGSPPEEAPTSGGLTSPGSPDQRAGLPKPPEKAFLAEMVKWAGADPKLTNESAADVIVAALKGLPFVVAKVERKERRDRPHPPFTTSTLQQQANIRLRFPTSRTMQTAQKLYEGIELTGMGQTALITYMRTDSTRISNDAMGAVRDFIKDSPPLGPKYLPDRPNVYASGKSAQEAHEAIRPTDVTITPKRAADMGLGGDQWKLYDLIWRRFVASQCNPAVLDVTTVDITAGQGLFRAKGQIVKFDGYRKVLGPVGGKQDDVTLPDMNQGETLDRLDLFETQHFTQPPPRYNEASLVKALEKEGIGRPSTYSSIISTIQKRGYVTQDRGRFFASDIGKKVTDLLVAHFPDIMNLQFTSHFEEELDDIETGKCKYRDVLDEFWGPFSEALDKAGDAMPGRETGEMCPKCGRALEERYSQKTKRTFIGCSGYKADPPCDYIKPREGEAERKPPEVTDIVCPACGKFMVKKDGRFGTFFTCEGAPDCPTTMNLGADGKPIVTALPTKNKCPKCAKQFLLLKESKKGKKYVQCPDKKCNFIADSDEQGNPVTPPDTGIKCEKCGSPMVVKVAWRGPFLSCSGFPKCRNAKSINAELREQLKQRGIDLPVPEKKESGEKAKSDVPDVPIADTCPECGAPMKLMKSRFGPGHYLGCTKYPKCKGKGKVSVELQARIDAAAAPAT